MTNEIVDKGKDHTVLLCAYYYNRILCIDILGPYINQVLIDESNSKISGFGSNIITSKICGTGTIQPNGAMDTTSLRRFIISEYLPIDCDNVMIYPPTESITIDDIVYTPRLRCYYFDNNVPRNVGRCKQKLIGWEEHTYPLLLNGAAGYKYLCMNWGYIRQGSNNTSDILDDLDSYVDNCGSINSYPVQYHINNLKSEITKLNNKVSVTLETKLRNGGFGNIYNPNKVCTTVLDVRGMDFVRIRITRPLSSNNCMYKIGYTLTKSEDAIGNFYSSNNYPPLVTERHDAGSVGYDPIINTSNAVGIIVEVIEYNPEGPNFDSNVGNVTILRVEDFAGYKIYPEEVNTNICELNNDAKYKIVQLTRKARIVNIPKVLHLQYSRFLPIYMALRKTLGE